MPRDSVKAALRRCRLWVLPLAVALAGCGDDGSDAENTILAGLDFPTDCEIGPCKATTTQYDGFGEWPLYTEQKKEKTYLYDAETLRGLGFAVVATPFALQLPTHMNSRDEYIRAVINDADCGRLDCKESFGEDSLGMCFELEHGSLLIPQEFCGGNGWPREEPSNWGNAAWPPSQWDVQNDCPGIVPAYSSGERGLIGLCRNPHPNCKALCTLVNLVDDEPNWLDLTREVNMQKFIDAGSCPPIDDIEKPGTYVNPSDQNFQVSCSMGKQPNWCTGKNMHFDGINDRPTGTVVTYKTVHCNKNGSRSVGNLGPKPVPPAPPQTGQLVIDYLSSRGFSAVSCQASGFATATSINSGTSAPVLGSATAASVSCYNSPTIQFTHDVENQTWSGPPGYTGACTPIATVTGAYECTVRDPS